MLDGIANGFRVTSQEYDGPDIWEANYKSVTNDAIRSKVEQQILEESDNGRFVITNNRPSIISALGAIKKLNGKICLIHDCSRPSGHTLNDLATLDKFSYESVNDAVQLISPGYWLSKNDLANAYRSVRLHSKDYNVAGIAWTFTGDSYPTIMRDERLMFGARLSPFIFHELSQAVHRIMSSRGFPNLITNWTGDP